MTHAEQTVTQETRSPSEDLVSVPPPDEHVSSKGKAKPTQEELGPTRPGQSPLFLDGWLEFNRQTFGLEPHRFSTASSDRVPEQAVLDAVLYFDSKGRVRRPDRNPYLPVSFKPSPSPYAHKADRQWQEHVGQLVEEMRSRGVVNEVPFPPNIHDIRSWQWSGYHINVKYTFQVDFPYDPARLSKQVRARIRRCEREGFRADRTTDIKAVYECLHATEERKGYSMGITLKDLECAHDLLGDDHFHAYIVYAPNGEAAGSAVTLHHHGSNAIGWLGGTRPEYLSSGAADLMETTTFTDLESLGATGIDLSGANMASIAAYKASLGARLVPYYAIESYNPTRLAKWLQSWWRFQRQRPKG